MLWTLFIKNCAHQRWFGNIALKSSTVTHLLVRFQVLFILSRLLVTRKCKDELSPSGKLYCAFVHSEILQTMTMRIERRVVRRICRFKTLQTWILFSLVCYVVDVFKCFRDFHLTMPEGVGEEGGGGVTKPKDLQPPHLYKTLLGTKITTPKQDIVLLPQITSYSPVLITQAYNV